MIDYREIPFCSRMKNQCDTIGKYTWAQDRDVNKNGVELDVRQNTLQDDNIYINMDIFADQISPLKWTLI